MVSFTPITPLWSVVLWTTALSATNAYFADWPGVGGRPNEPTCVDIPKNMSLCADIGYDKMRLPNLLEHDTLTEVQQQSGSWVPLLNVQCHPHTKLFLCSLFTPVCLENKIYPCRSLCESVQASCEERMKTYGYHWPDMLRCDKYPMDNDMCIKAPQQQHMEAAAVHSKQDEMTNSTCPVCEPVNTYENILDNFCRADTVIRSRIQRRKGRKVLLRKATALKGSIRKRKTKLQLDAKDADCCNFETGKKRYLIMGKKQNNAIVPTFVLPWWKSKALRDAVKIFDSLRCDDPNLFTATADDGRIVPTVTDKPRTKPKSTRKKDGKKNRKKTNKKKRKNKRKEEKKRKNRRKEKKQKRKEKKQRKKEQRKKKKEGRKKGGNKTKESKDKTKVSEDEIKVKTKPNEPEKTKQQSNINEELIKNNKEIKDDTKELEVDHAESKLKDIDVTESLFDEMGIEDKRMHE